MFYPKIIQNVKSIAITANRQLQKIVYIVSKIGIPLSVLINTTLILAIASEIAVFLVSYLVKKEYLLTAIINCFPGLFMAITIYYLRKPHRGNPTTTEALHFMQTMFLFLIGIKLMLSLFIDLPAILFVSDARSRIAHSLIISGLTIIGCALFTAFLGFLNCQPATKDLRKR